MNTLQRKQLSRFLAHQRIWVLDNDFRTNDEVLKKYADLIDQGETVFIWPKEFNGIKDINDLCIAKSLDKVPEKLFTLYSFSGEEAKRKLAEAL